MKRFLLFGFVLLPFIVYGQNAKIYTSNKQSIMDLSTFKTSEVSQNRNIVIDGERFQVELPDKTVLRGSMKYDSNGEVEGKQVVRYKTDKGDTFITREDIITVSIAGPKKKVITFYLSSNVPRDNNLVPEPTLNCTLTENKVDDFTGARELMTQKKSIIIYEREYEKGQIEFTLGYGKSGYYLIVANTYSNSNINLDPASKCLNGNSKLLIKKDDGSIIELPAIDHIVCSKYVRSKMSFIAGAFMISKENAQLLKDGIAKFRIQFTDNQFDGEFGGMAVQLGENLNVPNEPQSLSTKYFFKDNMACIESALAKDAKPTTTAKDDW